MKLVLSVIGQSWIILPLETVSSVLKSTQFFSVHVDSLRNDSNQAKSN